MKVTPDEELDRTYIYEVSWQDNECNDACFCSGYIEAPNGFIAQWLSLAGARVAIENIIDEPEYGSCKFTVWRRLYVKPEPVEYRVSNMPGRGRH